MPPEGIEPPSPGSKPGILSVERQGQQSHYWDRVHIEFIIFFIYWEIKNKKKAQPPRRSKGGGCAV